jgi:glucosyl-3-phosphoglycerate phosphatase
MMPDIVVYLVRHGRTHLNAEAVLRGHLDVALDDQGHHQAQRLGHTFSAVKIEAVITSPLLRARETAAAIAVTTRAPLTIEPRLIDRDYCDWAGLPESTLRQRYGSIDTAPDIETLATFTHRIVAALDDVTKRFAGQHVIVVAHDAVNRHLLASLVPAMGGDPAGIAQRPGCWNRLERSGTTWRAPVVDVMPDEGTRP